MRCRPANLLVSQPNASNINFDPYEEYVSCLTLELFKFSEIVIFFFSESLGHLAIIHVDYVVKSQ